MLTAQSTELEQTLKTIIPHIRTPHMSLIKPKENDGIYVIDLCTRSTYSSCPVIVPFAVLELYSY